MFRFDLIYFTLFDLHAFYMCLNQKKLSRGLRLNKLLIFTQQIQVKND